MDTLGQDIRYAIRSLIRTPGFAVVAIVTLALGIGANTAMFGIVHSVLLQPLPYAHPDRLVAVSETGTKGGDIGVSRLDLEDWRRSTTTLARIAGYGWGVTSISGGTEPLRASVAEVTPEFFDVFATPARLGRTFRDASPSSGAVISAGLWKRAYGARTDLAAMTVTVEGQQYPIAGVMPESFDYPHGVDVWLPLDLAQDNTSRSAHNYRLVADLRPGVSVGAAQAELSSVAARLAQAYPASNHDIGAHVVPLQSSLTRNVRPTLLLLVAMVALVLLIAATNVANLLLVRATARRREIAVRAALGARGSRIARQLLVESIVLAVSGGALGVLVAAWSVSALRSTPAMAQLPVPPDMGSPAVFAFAFALALATAILFGMLPAMHVTRVNLADVLKQTAGRGLTAQGLRGALIIGEVALAAVLLVGAGLTGRSLLRLEGEDIGFAADHLLVVDTSLPAADHGAGWVAAYTQLLSSARQVPGVSSAAITTTAPFSGTGSTGNFMIEGGASPDGESAPQAGWRAVSDGFFATLHVPLVRGRDFGASDNLDAPRVVMINAALARAYWPGRDPIGARIAVPGYDEESYEAYKRGANVWFTVIGVVGDVRDVNPGAAPAPTLYMPLSQHPEARGSLAIIARSPAPASSLRASIAAAVNAANPGAPLRISALDAAISATSATPRFRALLIGVFALLALTLAAIGIYGVSAYITEQRRPEFGVRLALGARPGQVLSRVIRQMGGYAVAGLVIGLAAALALGRLAQAFVYGVSVTDPVTFGVTAAALLASTLVATYVPARRAARLDPVIALRSE